MQNLLEQLKRVFAKDERLVDESGELLKNKIIELAVKWKTHEGENLGRDHSAPSSLV